jgi:hypothetical protein
MPNVVFPADLSSNRAVLARCFDIVRRALLQCIARDEAVSFVLLAAPNGTVYRLSVEDDGSLTTTAV